MCGMAFFALGTAVPSHGAVLQADEPPPELADHDLTELSLEELMDVKVTSVSKKSQTLADAGAAVFVVTGEDIRRMGVTSIPEALRMVPGLYVARIDANKWAVSARGFNDRFANKLLVLIDGRSVYTPLFAGVYWEAQSVPLQEIDRIEVIRGPGGTLWGANAVNGVINIITRQAKESQGSLVSVGYGPEERGFTTFRYGGKRGDSLHYRVYGKAFSRDTSFSPTGAHDDWQLGQGGFRADWQKDSSNALTLQGDYYEGRAGQQLTTPVPPGAASSAPAALTVLDEDVKLQGANLLFRWKRDLSEGADWMAQVYIDHVGREGVSLFEERNIVDLEFQTHSPLWGNHDLLWGMGYRVTMDETRANALFRLDPGSRTVDLLSGFLQDEITLQDYRLKVIIGSKFEHNDFSGFEYQPNLRVVWTPHRQHTVWTAVSRAVRTPSRGEQNVRLRVVPSPPTASVSQTLVGSDAFDSEDLLAYEFGYRFQPSPAWSFDAAAFYNQYQFLRTFDPITPPPTVSIPFDNNMHGKAYGIELFAQWRVRPEWRLQATYTYLSVDQDLDSGSTSTEITREDSSPNHQASLFSTLDLPHGFELDTDLRYVGDIKVTGMPVAGYVALDGRLGWKPRPELDLSLVGRNLLDNHHPEFLPTFLASQATEVDRSVFLRMTWQF